MKQPGYELDPQRSVLELIADDPAAFIAETTRELTYCRQGRFIIKASEIFTPPEATLESEYKAQAFIAGAATVLEAFAVSDLDEHAHATIQANFARQSAPINLLARDPQTTKSLWSTEAGKGKASHPEIRDHLDYIAHYFIEITQHPLFAGYSHIGGGFVARRLDMCYDDYMNMRVAKWLNIPDIKDIDWQQLLQ